MQPHLQGLGGFQSTIFRGLIYYLSLRFIGSHMKKKSQSLTPTAAQFRAATAWIEDSKAQRKLLGMKPYLLLPTNQEELAIDFAMFASSITQELVSILKVEKRRAQERMERIAGTDWKTPSTSEAIAEAKDLRERIRKMIAVIEKAEKA